MKTLRRQDLRTNELAEQLDHISTYAKSNAKKLAIWIGAIAALAAVVFGWMNYKSGRVESGWSKLASVDDSDPVKMIAEAREVAESGISPGLTVEAWLRIGQTALRQLSPTATPLSATTSAPDWAAKAKDAFERVVETGSANASAMGQALISLGILAEDRGDLAEATRNYKKVLDDSRLTSTPFHAQAEARLKGAAEWVTSVKFAPKPPEPPVLGPTTMPANIPVSPTSGPAAPVAGTPSTPAGEAQPGAGAAAVPPAPAIVPTPAPGTPSATTMPAEAP